MVTTVITAVAAARRHTNGSEDNCEDDGGPRLSGPLRKLRRQSSRLRNLLPLLGGTGGIGTEARGNIPKIEATDKACAIASEGTACLPAC
uniref:Uncharacterized protein n=1 Tax=Anopheles merus TaxID=30066 RepID=A0A182V6L0_ANOME